MNTLRYIEKHRLQAVSLGLISALAINGCSASEETEVKDNTSKQFVEGCETYAVYSQNRFQPYGTAVRAEPSTLAPKTDTIFAVNEVIPVDGWVRTGEVAYPTNPEPIANDIWFHLAHTGGWVSYAGVRGAPTVNDPTGVSPELGPLAELKPECEVQN